MDFSSISSPIVLKICLQLLYDVYFRYSQENFCEHQLCSKNRFSRKKIQKMSLKAGAKLVVQHFLVIFTKSWKLFMYSLHIKENCLAGGSGVGFFEKCVGSRGVHPSPEIAENTKTLDDSFSSTVRVFSACCMSFPRILTS